MPDLLTRIMLAEEPEKALTDPARILDESGQRGKIKIAYDEWNLRSWRYPRFPRTTPTTGDAYPAANYAVFSRLSGDSRTVFVQMRDNDEWAGIAGFQVVPRADPLPATPLTIQPSGEGHAVSLTWSPGLER